MRSDDMDAGQDAVLRSAIPQVDVELDDSREDLEQQIKYICQQALLPDGSVMAEQCEVRLCLRLMLPECPSPSSAAHGFRALAFMRPLQIRSIGGGITNKLYFFKNAALDKPVVVRRFGENTEMFIDRRVETSNTLQLNAYGFGAQLLASFNNGRLETFVNAYTLTPEAARHPLLVPKVAQRIAEYHACNIQHADRSPGLWPTVLKWCAPVESTLGVDLEPLEPKPCVASTTTEIECDPGWTWRGR